jgi:uncharacterized pyridoxal phosphate-containing UPF0001 family protein
MTTSPASFANHELVERVSANLAARARSHKVRCARQLENVSRVVAVTKTFGPEMVRAAFGAGLTRRW